jgi:hypothetical protein
MRIEHPKNDDYYFEKEREWRDSLPRYTDKHLLEIFPEAKEIIPRKIKEWKKKLAIDKDELKEWLAPIYAQKLDDFSTWFCERVARLFLMPSILEAETNILKLKRMRSILNPNNNRLEKWNEMVEKARQYPIYEIADSELDLKSVSDKYSALCPFHNEKHASFYIYTETNTFHCFGCGENGDVIKLTMHLHGIDFKEAVRMLQD